MYIIRFNIIGGVAFITKIEKKLGMNWIVYRLSINSNKQFRSIVRDQKNGFSTITFEGSSSYLIKNEELFKLNIETCTTYGKITKIT